VVLKLRMSQVTDVAEKEIQEPMADQVTTMEPQLRLCVFVECCTHLTNVQNFWLLWLSVFMQQLDCGECILNAPYGNVLSSLYFMSHCL